LTIGGERQAGREVKQINGIDLPMALVNLSDAMRMVSELTFIGSEASFEEKKRIEAKAKLSSKRAHTAQDSSSQEGA
jgi:hypothetical protein